LQRKYSKFGKKTIPNKEHQPKRAHPFS